jgi:hypothetical protein
MIGGCVSRLCGLQQVWRVTVLTRVQAFEAWFRMLQDPEQFFRRAYDKKLTCLGLIAIVSLPLEALPKALAASFPLVRCLRAHAVRWPCCFATAR